MFNCVPNHALRILIESARRNDPQALAEYDLARGTSGLTRETSYNLFSNEPVTGASGKSLTWKIQCEALTDEDWEWVAHRAVEIYPFFRDVVGVPTGGERFAEAVRKNFDTTRDAPVLIVDDVLTTGHSMLRYAEKLGLRGVDVLGVALFDRRARSTHGLMACGIFEMPAIVTEKGFKRDEH